MYIPISYWQTQGGGIPHLYLNYFSPPAQGVPKNIFFTYNDISASATVSVVSQIVPICLDANEFSDISLSDIPNTTEVNWAGAPFFCSAAFSGSNQCCINTPPITGPEAWYIDVSYRMNTNEGTVYWNYINQNGEIINETLQFGETKRIVAQTPPIFSRKRPNVFFDEYCDWNMVEKFPGQVLPYPYRTIPAKYTFQLKRQNVQTLTYMWPDFLYVSGGIDLQGFPSASNSAVFAFSTGSSLNATRDIIATNIPVDGNATNNTLPPCVWITNVAPLPKGAHKLQSCETTHSLWVTLNNYDKYPTGSVLKVSNTALTTTSSCWTVTDLTSSVSTSVSLTDVNVLNTYATCSACLA